MAPFEPQERNCLVVGQINPAILRPEWLVKNGILPEEQQIQVQVETQLHLGARLQFSMAGLRWRASPTRLVVEAVDPEADPGSAVAKIFQLLSHTPVQAVGNNFVFKVGDDFGSPLAGLTASALASRLDEDDLESLGEDTTIHFSGPSDAVLNVTVVTESGTARLVKMNFHREALDSASAASAAALWRDDLGEAERLLGRLEGLLE